MLTDPRLVNVEINNSSFFFADLIFLWKNSREIFMYKSYLVCTIADGASRTLDSVISSPCVGYSSFLPTPADIVVDNFSIAVEGDSCSNLRVDTLFGVGP